MRTFRVIQPEVAGRMPTQVALLRVSSLMQEGLFETSDDFHALKDALQTHLFFQFSSAVRMTRVGALYNAMEMFTPYLSHSDPEIRLATRSFLENMVKGLLTEPEMQKKNERILAKKIDGISREYDKNTLLAVFSILEERQSLDLKRANKIVFHVFPLLASQNQELRHLSAQLLKYLFRNFEVRPADILNITRNSQKMASPTIKVAGLRLARLVYEEYPQIQEQLQNLMRPISRLMVEDDVMMRLEAFEFVERIRQNDPWANERYASHLVGFISRLKAKDSTRFSFYNEGFGEGIIEFTDAEKAAYTKSILSLIRVMGFVLRTPRQSMRQRILDSFDRMIAYDNNPYMLEQMTTRLEQLLFKRARAQIDNLAKDLSYGL